MVKTEVQKPGAIKWAQGLSVFQIVVGVLAAGSFIWTFQIAEVTPFVESVQRGVAEGLGDEVSNFTSSGGVGYITGKVLVALLGSISALLAIKLRSKNWTIASLVVNTATLLNAFSLLNLAVLVLMLVRPSREYLNLTHIPWKTH